MNTATKRATLGMAVTLGTTLVATPATAVATPTAAPAAIPVPAVFVKTVKMHTTSGSTNVRSGPGTKYKTVGKYGSNENVSGWLHDNGWVHITSAKYNGKWVASWVLADGHVSTPAPPTPKPPTGNPSFWTALGSGNPIYRYRGSGYKTKIPVDYPITGTLDGRRGWVKITSGTYAGSWISGYHLTTYNPKNPPAGDTGKTNPVWVSNSKVTRYVLASQYKTVVRSQAGFGSNIVANVSSGTRFYGNYVNKYWFKVASGPYAGRYVSSGVLHYTSRMTLVNGSMPAGNLCPVPQSMSTTWEPNTTKYLTCAAVAGLNYLNTAVKRNVSSRGMTFSELYRDLGKQRFFFKYFGWPQAATPGTSNHGLGNAFDLDSDYSTFRNGTKGGSFLTRYGRNYGFDRPSYMDPGGSNPEWWHYNFIG